MKINTNDKFFIKHGGSHHGHGTAVFITTKITKQGNVYGEKWNKNQNKIINKNYKLDLDYILSKI